MNDSNLHQVKVNDWTVITDITKFHIFTIPILYPRNDMVFDLMNPGIGTEIECYNGFRIFSSYGEIRNKTVLITDVSRDHMATFVRSKNVPYNLTYEFTTPDGIYRNNELITTTKHYILKHKTISKIALLTKVTIFVGKTSLRWQMAERIKR